MSRITLARSLHDVGIAVWCGGSLMGAIGLNGAASTLDDPTQRGRAVNTGWQKWAPINAAAIGSHLIGGLLIVRANRGRIHRQHGVAEWTAAKTVLTGGALAATAATGYYGSRVWKEGDVPVASATSPSASTPAQAASGLRALKVLQWVVPALTGAIIVSTATMGEQQRPTEVAKGNARKAGKAARRAVGDPRGTSDKLRATVGQLAS